MTEEKLFDSIKKSLEKCSEKLEQINFYLQFLANNKDKIISLIQNQNPSFIEKQPDDFFSHLSEYITKISSAQRELNDIIVNFTEKDIENEYYVNFLKKDFVNYNWDSIYLINNFYYERAKLFDAFRDPLKPDDFQVINMYRDLINSLSHKTSSFNILINKVSSILIFKKTKHIKNNIVLIGANGSGKSTFARSLKGKLSDSFAIISAQHLLTYNNPFSYPIKEDLIKKVQDFQKNDKLGKDDNFFNFISNDFQNLILALFKSKIEAQKNFYESNGSNKEGNNLDKAINIWNSLIKNRKLCNTDSYVLEVKFENETYPLNNLSDGEKAILYYVGHVLLAAPHSYIIIDEPENHLHLSICNKMWDLLEQERCDCKFVYITHNINFAIARNNKTILWNKSFIPPFDWKFEEIKTSNNTIPTELMLEVCGCLRKIIFCEGDDRNSLDYKIYSRIFKEYDVIPILGHDNVIQYCKTLYNSFSINGIKAYGIIDQDHWSDEEIKAFNAKNIMVLPCNEIENFICYLDVLEKISTLVGCNKTHLQNFKKAFFKEVSENKENQALKFAQEKINNYIKSHLCTACRNLDDLLDDFEKSMTKDIIKEYYNSHLAKIDSLLNERDYQSLIKIVNLKKCLTNNLVEKCIVNDYENRFINLLDTNKDFYDFLQKKCEQTLISQLPETERNSFRNNS